METNFDFTQDMILDEALQEELQEEFSFELQGNDQYIKETLETEDFDFDLEDLYGDSF